MKTTILCWLRLCTGGALNAGRLHPSATAICQETYSGAARIYQLYCANKLTTETFLYSDKAKPIRWKTENKNQRLESDAPLENGDKCDAKDGSSDEETKVVAEKKYDEFQKSCGELLDPGEGGFSLLAVL